ncbi:MAG: undecaprenyldiphospho-muramoylpentapeptide beta-N-acetylglucosaminyltransferase [Bacteroidales bacterium]
MKKLKKQKKRKLKMSSKRIIIGGGGTGGHIFPAISIAQSLREKDPGLEILFVGAENKIEMEKVPEAGFRIIGLPVSGLQRKLTWKNISFLLNLIRSSLKSATIIKEFKPDLAAGVGGYASGPILRAAANKGVPTVIQEQNSYAGLTNRLLAKKARKIFVAYEGMEKYFPGEKIILTGNPVRKDIVNVSRKRKRALEFFSLNENQPVILVIGGSLGAGTINNSIYKGLALLGKEIQLIWQTGKYYYEKLQEKTQDVTGSNIKLFPFIKEMDLAFAAADVIISRAGAGTISELALVGKPVILVPSPNVAEDHQTKNAMSLVKKEAAIHIADADAEEKLVSTCLELLKDKTKREKLGENIKSLALPDSANRIAEEILKLV